MDKCENCKKYSNNIDDDNLKDGYCCREDVGYFCKRQPFDYCSYVEPIVTCETCIYNEKISPEQLNKIMGMEISIQGNAKINKCKLKTVYYKNDICKCYEKIKQ